MHELVHARVFAELETNALPVGAFVVYLRLVAAGARRPIEISNVKLHRNRRTAVRSVGVLAAHGHIKVKHVEDESGARHRFVTVKR